MAADCCGGEYDLFLGFTHKPGCPSRQVGAARQAAERDMEAGRRSSQGVHGGSSTSPSYQLGRKKEQDRQVKHIVDEVFGFPIGGRRRRGPLL